MPFMNAHDCRSGVGSCTLKSVGASFAPPAAIAGIHAHEPLVEERGARPGIRAVAAGADRAHQARGGVDGQHHRQGPSRWDGGAKKNGPQSIGRSRVEEGIVGGGGEDGVAGDRDAGDGWARHGLELEQPAREGGEHGREVLAAARVHGMRGRRGSGVDGFGHGRSPRGGLREEAPPRAKDRGGAWAKESGGAGGLQAPHPLSDPCWPGSLRR